MRPTRNFDNDLQESERLNPDRDNEDGRLIQLQPREKAVGIATNTDRILLSGFSVGEKMKVKSMQCFRTREANKSKSEQLLARTTHLNFEPEKYVHKGLCIKIKRTSVLTLNQNLLHPFVRLYVVDLQTFRMLEKEAARKAGSVNNRESAGITSTSEEKRIVRPINCDFLPPMATSFCDMRLSTDNWASWNEEFQIHENLDCIFKPKTLLLFELLDFNISYLAKDAKKDNPLVKGTGSANKGWDNLYRIAWGYLRPVGGSGIHTGSVRLQLYKYKHKGPRPDTLDERTPQVLLDFNWFNHTKYPGFLEVDLSFKDLPEEDQILQEGEPQTEWSKTPYEKERGLKIYGDLELGGREPIIEKAGPEAEQQMTQAERARQIKLSKWRRGIDQNCLLPNELLDRLPTAEFGCFRIKFSPNGLYLAAACSVSPEKTIIKIFQTEDSKQIFQLFGHQGVIHDIRWHHKNRYLLSTSSDCSVRLWSVPPRAEGNQMTEKGSYELLMCTIIHPSFVYSADFQSINCSKSRLLIATASFDSKVRIHVISLDPVKGICIDNQCLRVLDIRVQVQKVEPLSVLENIHPNALVFNDEVLYVGDSRGTIHEWQVNLKSGIVNAQKVRTIKHADLEGDAINYIAIEPEEGKKLVVHSRDNCIRLIQHWGDRVKISQRFFGSKCKDVMVRSVISPDGQYLIAGSEDGTPHVWQVLTGSEEMEAARHFECALMDSVCDVDWNPEYNMIAMSGFGKEYPVMVYVYEKSREELALEQGAGFYQDDFLTGRDKIVESGFERGLLTPATTLLGASNAFSQWR